MLLYSVEEGVDVAAGAAVQGQVDGDAGGIRYLTMRKAVVALALAPPTVARAVIVSPAAARPRAPSGSGGERASRRWCQRSDIPSSAGWRVRGRSRGRHGRRPLRRTPPPTGARRPRRASCAQRAPRAQRDGPASTGSPSSSPAAHTAAGSSARRAPSATLTATPRPSSQPMAMTPSAPILAITGMARHELGVDRARVGDEARVRAHGGGDARPRARRDRRSPGARTRAPARPAARGRSSIPQPSIACAGAATPSAPATASAIARCSGCAASR